MYVDIIRNVKIYLKDPKDKSALKKAKEALEIQNCNKFVGYSGLLDMIIHKEPKIIEYFQIPTKINIKKLIP